jgi:hypothetical protein
MRCRRFSLIGLVVVAAFGIARAQQAPAPARDWTTAPAIVEVAHADHVIAIGDTHGDYERAVELLAKTGVIAAVPTSAAGVHWAAGAALLVCTGDMIDKYNRSIDVITLFRTLQQEAPAAGGRVIVTLGNHEAEFLAGAGTNKKGAEFESELKAAGISPADVAAGRDAGGVGVWLRTLPAAARVGNWFFCHAGDTSGLTLAELSEKIQAGVTAEGFATPMLVGPTSLLEARLHPHPWWEESNRPKAHGKKEKGEAASAEAAELESGIAALGAKHLVMGHQPGKVKFADKTERPANTLFTKFKGAIFFIDCGMSRGVDGAVGAVLEIHASHDSGTATARYADGRTVSLLK